MRLFIVIVVLQFFIFSCITKKDIEGAKNKVDTATIKPQNLHPCEVDSICQNQYDVLIKTAFDLVQNDSNKTTESIHLATKKLNEAKVKAEECGECLDRQIVKWTVINKSSILGYKSSENLYKGYKDNDHKLRMGAYKALVDVSNEPPQ